MDPSSKLQLLTVRTSSMLRTLNSEPKNAKTEPISIPMAERFNAVLDEARELLPDFAHALPARIEATTDFAPMGLADVTYLEFEMLLEELVSIIEFAGQRHEG